MKSETLKKSTQKHFEPFELAEDRLEQLLQLQQDHQPRKVRPNVIKWGASTLAMCACFVLVWVMVMPSVSPVDGVLGSIAEEVAKNHIKLKPLEVTGSSLKRVGVFFDRLNFAPIQSSIFSLSPNQLIGGRYCSIQGEAASQLRYLNKSGNPVTLYQAILPTNLLQQLPNADKGEPPAQLNARGVAVRIWAEKGLVMASVNES